MEKLIIPLLLLLSLVCFAQEQIFYNSTPTIEWEPVTTLDDPATPEDDLIPLLPEDVVTYELYMWDTDANVNPTPPIAELVFIGVTDQTEYTLSFPERRNWGIAIRSVLTDGEGTVSYSGLSYTTELPPVTLTTPFVYAPTLLYIPQEVRGLTDSGM